MQTGESAQMRETPHSAHPIAASFSPLQGVRHVPYTQLVIEGPPPPCYACNQNSKKRAAELRRENGLSGYAELSHRCARSSCWQHGVFSQYGAQHIRDSNQTLQAPKLLLMKNPEALFWPHLATVHASEALRCSTVLLTVLREPVARALSHFRWYHMQLPFDRKWLRRHELEHSSAHFAWWVELSMAAYSELGERLASPGLASELGPELYQKEVAARWRDAVYRIESLKQRAHWARFLANVSLQPPDAAKWERSMLAHNGLALVKGALQSLYFPQTSCWLEELGPRSSQLRIVQSELFFSDSTTQLRGLLPWMRHLPVAAAQSPSVMAAAKEDSGSRMASPQWIAPKRSAVVSTALQRLQRFFVEPNERLFEQLERIGQPFQRKLWHANAAGHHSSGS